MRNKDEKLKVCTILIAVIVQNQFKLGRFISYISALKDSKTQICAGKPCEEIKISSKMVKFYQILFNKAALTLKDDSINFKCINYHFEASKELHIEPQELA